MSGLEKKEKIRKGKESSEKENTIVEILKEGQECPNCHYAKLKREGNDPPKADADTGIKGVADKMF